MSYNTNFDGGSTMIESLDQSPVASSRATILVPTSQATGIQPVISQSVVVGPLRDPDLSVPRLPGSAKAYGLDKLLER